MNPTYVPLLVAAPAVGGLYAYSMWQSRQQPSALRSLARPRDVAALTPRNVTRSAKRLRNLDGKRPPLHECGVALGRLMPHGPALTATWEDVAVAIMAPRTGKTTALAIPAVLNSPGPVVATSNKRDLWDATASRDGICWTFDPQHIVGAPQLWWWDALADITNVESAHRFATHFVSTVEDDNKRDIWGPAARQLISGMALAARLDGRTALDLYRWVCAPHITEAADIVDHYGFAQVAQGVRRIMGSPDKTRDSVYVTASVAMQCLADPDITAWVTPHDDLPQLNPDDFVGSHDTLHLLSKDGGGSAAPLVAALTDSVLRAGVRAAERQPGARLDPPLVVVLDEAANVCRIADLPKLYSHFGSRGIFPLTILQSWAQGAQAWGHTGIKELWGATTVKLVGPGMDDATFAGDLSRLIGEHDVLVPTTGYGRGGASRSRTPRESRILSPAKVRALETGTALLFATGSKPALVRLQPWYKNKKWRDDG